MADMKEWSSQRAPGGGFDEDPVPTEELPPEETARMQGGGTKSPEQMENLVLLVRTHLQEIEEQVQSMEPTTLLADDMELPEDHADKILELVDTWDDGLPELLSGIAPEDAIAVGEQVKDEVQEVEPILIGAWLWRAGELS